MKNLKAILNLSKASATEVAVKAATIVNKMTGNGTYATPSPPLADITDLVDKLNTALAEQQTVWQSYHEKTVEVQSTRDKLLNTLELERNYVDTVAQGDKLAILSSGFEVRQKPMPFGMLPAPANVSAEAGGSDGEIIVKWDSVKGARSYIVEESFDISDPENWAYQATVTKTKCYISGMESGIRIWVRVVAVNAAGQGAYSDVATKTVP